MFIEEEDRLYWFYLEFAFEELLDMCHLCSGAEFVLVGVLVVGDYHFEVGLGVWWKLLFGIHCG